MSHANISIFVPHNGCPHQCSFCNQRGITGVSEQPSYKDIVSAIEASLKNTKNKNIKDRELAFFGGSFTALNRDYMVKLLESASSYIKSGKIRGIRISTRPDAINSDILDLLKFYGVTSIELGAQSMVDNVLKLNNRGHVSKDVEISSNQIKSVGFELGLQMMVGLYGSDYEKDLYTCNRFIDLKPDTVRIYPTVIMQNTKLAGLYNTGDYIPMDFDDTVELCTKLLDRFESSEIEVIRLGLHSSESLKKDIIAGAWHPAFREICESKRFLNMFIGRAKNINKNVTKLKIIVNPRDVSKVIGQNKCNIKSINDMGFNVKIFQDESVNKNSIEVEELF